VEYVYQDRDEAQTMYLEKGPQGAHVCIAQAPCCLEAAAGAQPRWWFWAIERTAIPYVNNNLRMA